MTLNELIMYQIYPLGFTGAPREGVAADTKSGGGFSRLTDYLDYLTDMGFNALLLNPVFYSDRHGYDTRDFCLIDPRLGTLDEFKSFAAKCGEKGIKLILDGVFNHVGRGFWAFRDVMEKREASQYKDWFHINFSSDSLYGDGFSYEAWEGHFELVKLNLTNEKVRHYLYSVVLSLVENFKIDGLRLDVAYCLDHAFLRELRTLTDERCPGFVLLGEVLFGDYRVIVNDAMCHTATNYECYKGIYSSLNSQNMFEIAYSLNRQFGAENWTIYKDLTLMSFLDNHDVTRIASMLERRENLRAAHTLVFTMPGFPCVYYGSEWGEKGVKNAGGDGDCPLRPKVNEPIVNELGLFVKKLISIRKNSSALKYGSYKNIIVTNRQLVFERQSNGERLLIAVNADSENFCIEPARLNVNGAVDLISGEREDPSGGFTLKPYDVKILKVD